MILLGKSLNINKAIGLIVLQYLKDNGLENKDFAKRSKLSRATLYRIISGNHTTTTDTLVLLANGMDTKLSVLINKAEQLMKK